MSSRKPVSTARPQTFWSIEYGDFFVTSIGRSWASANSMALSRVSAQVADRRDAGEIRGEVADADLEADLVVALAGAAVADDGRAVLCGGGDQMLDDRRPGERRDQRVAVHVERVGLERGQAVLVGELLAGVDDIGLDGAAASARWRMTSRSSPPWPTSTAQAITSAPVSSAIQPIATEVSSPPE